MSENKVGRPSKYNAVFHPKLAEALARNGFTDEEMCKEMEISHDTFYVWRKEYREFSDAITRGKAGPDDKVEQALYKRALGFREPAVKIFMPAGAKAPIYAPFEEYYPPDTGAAFIWLKNRRPNKWRDRTELQVDDAGPKTIIINRAAKPKE